MKIGLLQLDAQNGDLPGNTSKIVSACQLAASQGATLCMAPLEALCGPQIFAYADQEDFRLACQRFLREIAATLACGPALICGSPFQETDAILLDGGEYIRVPNCFTWRGLQFCLINPHKKCGFEDIKNIDFLLHLHAHAYRPHFQQNFEDECANIAQFWGSPLLSVNLTGGYGSLVYSGQSFVMSPSGKLLAAANAFQEETLIWETPDAGSIAREPGPLESQWLALVTGTRDFMTKCGAKTAVLGLSGGMDSALAACIAVEAVGGDNVLGALMPSPYTSQDSIDDAQALAANLGMQTVTLNIKPMMEAFNFTLEPIFDQLPAAPGELSAENLQPRIRGTLLMAIANRTGALVLNTGNRSESSMGYCTLYGDTVGALSVLGDLYKTRIYELARWYCESRGHMVIPPNIFDKAPSAELKPDQKDTDSLPPYEVLDPILKTLAQTSPDLSETRNAQFNEIRQQVYKNQFKRAQMPPILQVGEASMPTYPIIGNYHTGAEPCA